MVYGSVQELHCGGFSLDAATKRYMMLNNFSFLTWTLTCKLGIWTVPYIIGLLQGSQAMVHINLLPWGLAHEKSAHLPAGVFITSF